MICINFGLRGIARSLAALSINLKMAFCCGGYLYRLDVLESFSHLKPLSAVPLQSCTQKYIRKTPYGSASCSARTHRRVLVCNQKKVTSEICKQCFIGERLHRAALTVLWPEQEAITQQQRAEAAWLLSSLLPLHFVSQTVLPGLTVLGLVLKARQLT